MGSREASADESGTRGVGGTPVAHLCSEGRQNEYTSLAQSRCPESRRNESAGGGKLRGGQAGGVLCLPCVCPIPHRSRFRPRWTDEYEYALGIVQSILPETHTGLFKLALGLREFSPAVEMSIQVRACMSTVRTLLCSTSAPFLLGSTLSLFGPQSIVHDSSVKGLMPNSAHEFRLRVT